MISFWILSCTNHTPDVDSAEEGWDTNISEDSAIIAEETCPLFPETTQLTFQTVPAMSAPQRLSLSIQSECAQKHVLLLSPEEWIADPHFSVERPSSTRIENEAELTIVLTPGWEQNLSSTLIIPYTHPESPLSISLEATVTAPLPLLLIGGQLRRILSADYGQSITQETQDSGTQRNICWGNDSFLIVGGAGEGTVWRSQNALNWQEYILETEDIYACAYGNNRFIMYASGLYSSIAGVEWEEGQDTPWMEDTIRDIAFANGIFVAVGDQGRIATTTHGLHWNRDALQGNFQLNSVTYGNNLFVAVGNFGAVLWSDDNGETWTTERVGESTFQKVVFGNGYFYLSDGSNLYRSEDATIWSTINTEGIKPLVAYGSILIGMKGQSIYHSVDRGENWSLQQTLGQGAPIVNAIIGGVP